MTDTERRTVITEGFKRWMHDAHQQPQSKREAWIAANRQPRTVEAASAILSRQFTSADARTMPSNAVTGLWIARQIIARENGEPHYAVLRNSDKRGKVVATIY